MQKASYHKKHYQGDHLYTEGRVIYHGLSPGGRTAADTVGQSEAFPFNMTNYLRSFKES